MVSRVFASARSMVSANAPTFDEYAPSAPCMVKCPPLAILPDSPCTIVTRSLRKFSGSSVNGSFTSASGTSIRRAAVFPLRSTPSGWSRFADMPLLTVTNTNRFGVAAAPATGAACSGCANGVSSNPPAPADTRRRNSRRLETDNMNGPFRSVNADE